MLCEEKIINHWWIHVYTQVLGWKGAQESGKKEDRCAGNGERRGCEDWWDRGEPTGSNGGMG